MQKDLIAAGVMAFLIACSEAASVTSPAMAGPSVVARYALGLPDGAATDTLFVGQSRQLSANLPRHESRIRASATSWKSSRNSVAFVTPSGVVTAVGLGTALITASNDLGSEQATIVVRTNSVAECALPRPEWIWCDDFEADRLVRYFEYDAAGGGFTRNAGVGHDGSSGMRARFAAGAVGAGSLHLAFGRTPQSYMQPVDAGTANYRELYWRVYVRNAPGWTGGGGDKLTRAMIFASPTSWAQAMIAHVWSGGQGSNHLVIDPASGTSVDGILQTTVYNDFARFRWLGYAESATPIFAAANVGTWRCIETHVLLNDAGWSNGVFELFIDGTREAQRTGLNWVGRYDTYGLNAVFLENYWNAGSPVAQDRFFDRLVVSTAPIGC